MNDDPLSSAPELADPAVTLEELASAHRSLRTAFHVSLVLLVILSGSLFIFFLREVSLARRQMNELTTAVLEYEKSAVPLMEDFRMKLQAFSSRHPDFLPIYTKYFGQTNAPAANPGAAQPLSNSNTPRLPPPP